MTRRFRSWTWAALFVGLAGCGDNIAAVQRDYYNLKHEILDNMASVVDEESAKRFNLAYANRLKDKHTANRERSDKIRNNQFTQKDRDALDLELKMLNDVTLKGQRTSASVRLFQTLNRIRRSIVRLTEEKAMLAKQQNQSFTIKSREFWPSMTALDCVADFAGLGQEGAGGMMMPMMPMMMGKGPPGAPGAQAQEQAPPEEKIDPRAYQSPEFVLECRRIEGPGGPWQDTPSWRLGNNTVPPLIVMNVDLLPLKSN
jgi:hypothetical protein